MGIGNLMKQIGPATKPVQGVDLKRQKIRKVAVDTLIWICQLTPYYGSNVEQFIFRRIENLRRFDVEPILVFDGERVGAKRKTHLKRLKNAQNAKQKRAQSTSGTSPPSGASSECQSTPGSSAIAMEGDGGTSPMEVTVGVGGEGTSLLSSTAALAAGCPQRGGVGSLGVPSTAAAQVDTASSSSMTSHGHSMDQVKKVELEIVPKTGASFAFVIDPNESIEGLKKALEKKLMVDKEHICLLHRDLLLESSKRIRDYGLVDGSRVSLVPSVETGLLTQRPEQSVLNETQVGDSLSGKLPLMTPSPRVSIKETIESLKKMCKMYAINYVQSPYEADSQIAYMVKKGEVDCVVSTDTDYTVYGCQKVLFSFRATNGLLYERKDFKNVWGQEFNQQAFQAVCILLGCDYYDGGLKGFGPRDAPKLYKKLCKLDHFDYDQMVKMLKKLGYKIPTDLKDKFFVAWHTFRHQLVLDKESGKIVPYLPYEEGKSSTDFPFAGDLNTAKGEYFDSSERPTTVDPPALWTGTEEERTRRSFMCSECPCIAKSLQALKLHRKLFHLICQTCGRSFLKKSELIRHKYRHLPEKPFPCDECKKGYYSPYDLKYHKVAAHGTERYPCNECVAVFPHPIILRKHQLYVHVMERKFVCDNCGAAFKLRKDLMTHLQTHLETKPHVCQECGDAFKQIGLLRNHVKLRHTLPHKCTDCTERFSTEPELHAHVRECVKERPFKCEICQEGFTTNDILQKHMIVHTEERPYKCSQCGKGFKKAYTLNCHVKTHNDEKPFQCSQCPISFNLGQALRNHVIRFHTKLPFECQQCERSFKSEKQLQSHMNRTHAKPKPYKCEQCNKTFTDKSSLTRHSRIHSTDNPFRCPHCGNNWVSAGPFQKHLNKCKKKV